MALTQNFSGVIALRLYATISRTQDSGAGLAGRDEADHDYLKLLTDGATDLKATGFFSATFVVTTSRTTIRLASFTDPLQGLGDDVPTSDPNGLHIKCLIVENLSLAGSLAPTLLIGTDTVTGPLLDLFGGTNPTIKCGTPAQGGAFVWVGQSPAATTLVTGSNDGVSLQTTNDSANVRLTYFFG